MTQINPENGEYRDIFSLLKDKSFRSILNWKNRSVRCLHIAVVTNKKKVIYNTLCENDGDRTCICGKFTPCSIHAEYRSIYILVKSIPELKSISNFINPFHCHKIRLILKMNLI